MKAKLILSLKDGDIEVSKDIEISSSYSELDILKYMVEDIISQQIGKFIESSFNEFSKKLDIKSVTNEPESDSRDTETG